MGTSDTTIYLDNAATTRMAAEVFEAMRPWLGAQFGNPSSRHPFGVRAADEIDAARRSIARATCARAEDVVFTSGGTESNNLAVIGGACVAGRSAGRILIGPAEHPSVRRPAEALVKRGFSLDVARLRPDGTIDEDDFRARLKPDTVLVSIMTVSNEFGTLYPIRELCAIARACSPRAIFHTDAVQAFGKFEVDLDELGVDALSLSGHKFHGPTGTGVLVHRPGLQLMPILHGGGQEQGLRSGTQNVSGIVGIGRAAQLAEDQREEVAQHLTKLRTMMRDAMLELGGIRPLEPGNEMSPAILAAVVEGPPAEVWMHHLELQGVIVSAGSACHSRQKEISPAYKSLGLNTEQAKRVLRFSFCDETTTTEIEHAIRGLGAVCSELQNIRT